MRLLITGASGQFGSYLLREAAGRGARPVGWSGSTSGDRFGVSLKRVELSDVDRVAEAFRAARSEAVIHAGAISTVAECFRDPVRARQVNTRATTLLAQLAAEAGVRLVYPSTDLVFDGERGGYREEDPPAPLSVYGRTKADAEGAVLACPRGAVIRLSLLFGPSLSGRPSFFDHQVDALRERRPVTLFADEWRTPLDLLTAAQALLALAESDCEGLLHLGGPERLSRLEMGRRLAAFLGGGASAIVPARRADAPAPESRPRDTSLDSSRWRKAFPQVDWPAWSDALARMMGPLHA